MAKVKTFLIHPEKGVHDSMVAEFITECEAEHYVSVVAQFIPVPTPRLTVIVTKLDEKAGAGTTLGPTGRPWARCDGNHPTPRCADPECWQC